MSPSDSSFLKQASAAVSVIIILLVLFSLDDNRLECMLYKEQAQPWGIRLKTLPPENLLNAAKDMRLSLPAEISNFPIDALQHSSAWITFQQTLSTYVERQKLLDTQNEQLDKWLQWRRRLTSYALLAASITLFVISTRIKRHRPPNQNV